MSRAFSPGFTYGTSTQLPQPALLSTKPPGPSNPCQYDDAVCHKLMPAPSLRSIDPPVDMYPSYPLDAAITEEDRKFMERVGATLQGDPVPQAVTVVTDAQLARVVERAVERVFQPAMSELEKRIMALINELPWPPREASNVAATLPPPSPDTVWFQAMQQVREPVRGITQE